MKLNKRELGAVLAGLRLLNLWLRDEDLSDNIYDFIIDIATNNDTQALLLGSQIDALCERLSAEE